MSAQDRTEDFLPLGKTLRSAESGASSAARLCQEK